VYGYFLPRHVRRRMSDYTGGIPVFHWQWEAILRRTSPFWWCYYKVRSFVQHWSPAAICQRRQYRHLWEEAMTHGED